ncbi:MAG: hypothetical protein ACHQ5A_10230 [Opitutales bacterium]
MIPGIPQNRLTHYFPVTPIKPREVTPAPVQEENFHGQLETTWQSQIKLQQAMRVYRQLDEAEVMQDVR